MTRVRSIVQCLIAACLLVILWTPPAGADPAGPTDYRTDIVSISPPSDAISVRIIGGDSFFEVTQLQPVSIEITGYRGEPYLRFLADGTVEENRLAPTTYLNEERYGGGEIVPDFADPEAAPTWEAVADGGRYAWHDHRSHWMNPNRPPGAQAGDTVLEAVIPLSVDGQVVEVSVASFLQSDPSPGPWLAGGLVGLVFAAAIVRTRVWWLVVPVAAVVLLVGAITYFSVPNETGPPFTLWVLPLSALASSIGAAVLSRRRSPNLIVPVGLGLLAGVQLLLWSLLQREALTAAILPTEVPWTWFRVLVAGGFATGGGAVVTALIQLRKAFSLPVSPT